MQHNIRVLLLLGLLTLAACQQRPSSESAAPTWLILVRHAEKASDGSTDPPLTAQGEARAQKLAALLAEERLAAVYSTPYRRTQQTALPSAEAQGLPLRRYEASASLELFLDSLLLRHAGGTVLVVGHSNTIPRMANLLLGEARYADLDEQNYDGLFIARARARGQAEVKRLVFF